MWKIKYYGLCALSYVTRSDRLWEKAWAYGYKNTFGKKPTKQELDDVFGRNL